MIRAGDGVAVTGAGRPDNPFVISAEDGGGDGSGWAPGDLKWSARSSAPAGWLVADGSEVSRTAYPDLFDAIGVVYGAGDGSTSFNLPRFTDRFAFGASPDHPLGSSGGSETKTLVVNQLPVHHHDMTHDHDNTTTGSAGAHDHELTFSDEPGNVTGNVPKGKADTSGTSDAPVLNAGAHDHTVNIPTHTGNTGNTGSGQPVNIMPPYAAALPLIKT